VIGGHIFEPVRKTIFPREIIYRLILSYWNDGEKNKNMVKKMDKKSLEKKKMSLYAINRFFNPITFSFG